MAKMTNFQVVIFRWFAELTRIMPVPAGERYISETLLQEVTVTQTMWDPAKKTQL